MDDVIEGVTDDRLEVVCCVACWAKLGCPVARYCCPGPAVEGAGEVVEVKRDPMRLPLSCSSLHDSRPIRHRPDEPALAFVHFSDPDDKGHSDGWGSPAQLDAIGKSDRCLGILYEALDAAGLLDETLIIVSADHGGHNHVHSGALAIDREIPWIASGPGVRKDFLLTGNVSTMDTAATALYARGLGLLKTALGKR